MNISVIIPTFNEEGYISSLVRHLQQYNTGQLTEILVIDGGSSDQTVQNAQQAGARVLRSPKKGRAIQMNTGARHASGDILYFVHADVLPPSTYLQDIIEAVEKGYPIGCCRTQFDSQKLMLKINGYCSRFDGLMCRGGDQTLFVTKTLFEHLDGYDEYYSVMEEYDFIRRARLQAKFKIVSSQASVSARKYDSNSYFKVNLANLIVFTMFRLGYPPDTLRRAYYKMIKYPAAK